MDSAHTKHLKVEAGGQLVGKATQKPSKSAPAQRGYLTACSGDPESDLRLSDENIALSADDGLT